MGKMIPVYKIREGLQNGAYNLRLGEVYENVSVNVRVRASELTEKWQHTFKAGDESPAALFSAPGRTEIGGNHTDHENGCVLAAAVNADMLACAAPNGTNNIRFLSEGWPLIELGLDALEPREEETESTSALIRGIAAKITELGYKVGGFDAYACSDVLPGSGLSSSAAFEVLVGVIINHFFCDDKLTDVEIAQIGQYAENKFFGKPSGLMDQMASSVGGAVAIDFRDPDNPKIEKLGDALDRNYALCIVDSGASHAELTGEYAAIPNEMKTVARIFGKSVLREVDEDEFWSFIPRVREQAGDRAVLRAMHFFEDNRRAQLEAEALRIGDLKHFLTLVNESGESSWMYLQNICPTGSVSHQEMGIALATASHALKGRGACRVHGGGFAGTIQAFVPLEMLEEFKKDIEGVLGEGRCHVLSVRAKGGAVVIS